MGGLSQRRSKWRPYALTILVGLGLLGCFVLSNWWTHLETRTPTFCTQNDEVYQMMNKNLNYWIKYFRTQPFPNINSVLFFQTPSGDGYDLDASLWKYTSDPPILFVVIDRGWQEHYGNEGYWYSNPTK